MRVRRYTEGMNEQQLTQLIRRIKTVRESLALLLGDLQDLAYEDLTVAVTDDDPKLQRFTVYAKRKVVRAEGDWVSWTDLRPAYRDRDLYSELLWETLTEDPELETRTTPFGPSVRREVRYDPLI